MLSSPSRGIPKQGNRASICVEGGISRSFPICSRKLWFPSSCDGDLREFLMVPMGSQESFGVVRALSGFLWGRCNGRGPHLQLRREPQGSSPVLTWISGCVQFQTGSQVSTCVEAWNSAFLSSCQRGFRPPVELNWGPGAFLEIATGLSDLPSCCELILEFPFESVQSESWLISNGWGYPCLSNCGKTPSSSPASS